MARMTHTTAKKLYIRKPSFSATGSTVVTVGRSSWHIAPDWLVAYQMDRQLAWVLLPGDDLRLLNEHGEVAGIPTAILDAARQQFFPTT